MYAINLSWEQSNEILQWAMYEQVDLRITVRLAKDWTEVSSQFLGGKVLKTLIVRKFSLPWTGKMLISQLLPCSFRMGNKKLLFVSAILDQCQVKVGDSLEDAYILTWPESLQQVQRRFYFRASVPSDMPLKVKVWPSVPVIDVAPSEPPIDTGRLIDISVGGMQVELHTPNKLELDRCYLLELELPKPEPPMLLQAQAKRLETVSEHDRIRCGLHFLSLDHSPKGQDNLLRLARVANYIRSLEPEPGLAERK